MKYVYSGMLITMMLLAVKICLFYGDTVSFNLVYMLLEEVYGIIRVAAFKAPFESAVLFTRDSFK